MTYFYNRVGGSTLIAISMHGLHNDSVFLQGRINAEGLGPYVVSELTLLAPIVVVACILLFVSGRRLGLEKRAGDEPGGSVARAVREPPLHWSWSSPRRRPRA